MEQQPDQTINNDKKQIIILKGHNQMGPPKKKRKGPIHILRVAMSILRLKTGKSKSTKVQAASAFKNVVGSMRPLHLQNDQTPPRLIEAAVPVPEPKPNSDPVINFEPFEAFTPPTSPALSCASSSIGSASRYASAHDLRALWHRESESEDEDDEKYEEDDKYYDDKHGDDLINFKAEEFITRFYEQMRLERLAHD